MLLENLCAGQQREVTDYVAFRAQHTWGHFKMFVEEVELLFGLRKILQSIYHFP